MIRRLTLTRALVYGVLLAFAIYYVFPLYLVFATSFKRFADVSLSTMWDWPSPISLESFAQAWNGRPEANIRGIGDGFLNSVRMVVPATVISCILGSLNGYVLSKWRFRGSETLFTLILFGMFIPYQSILIPLVRFLQSIQLYATISGLVLVHVVYGIPITTLIFRNYYAGVPNELVEAARIDGANFFRIYRSVLLPLSIPGFVVVAIWQFTQIWNEYLFAVVISSTRAQPATVALQNMGGGQFTEYNVQMAGALIVAAPTLLVYVLLGRYFLRGLLAGAMKG